MHFSKILSYDLLDNDNTETNSDIMKEKKPSISSEECIICLENYYEKTYEEPKQLTYLIQINHKEIIKECDCDCAIHEKCLNKWLSNNDTCIICREEFCEEESESEPEIEYIDLSPHVNTDINHIRNMELREKIIYILQLLLLFYIFYRVFLHP
jgi:hypothetical protein